MTHDANERTAPPMTRAPGASFVFWLLVLMALAVFAPCVLLPEWRQYQAIRLAEQAQEHRVEALRRAVGHERRVLDAMTSDPGVIARLAQRELQFRRPDERFVPVSIGADSPNLDSGAFVPQPVELPDPLQRAAAALPKFDYDSLFCDPQTSKVLMTMSVALLGIAFGVVARTPDRPTGTA